MNTLTKTVTELIKRPTLPPYALDGRPLNWSPSENAVSFDSTEDEYQSDSHAACASVLIEMARSPVHLHNEPTANGTGRSLRTPAMAFGTVLRSAVLQNHELGKHYAAHILRRPATSIPKEIFSAAVACARQALGTVVIRTEGAVFTMADLVQMGIRERTYYWVDAESGVTCRARLDLTVQNVIIDLKTAQDAGPESFKSDAEKFGYHIQASFFMDAFRQFLPEVKEPVMIFLVAESNAPHRCKVYQAEGDGLCKLGKIYTQTLLTQYRENQQALHWPVYETRTQKLKRWVGQVRCFF